MMEGAFSIFSALRENGKWTCGLWRQSWYGLSDYLLYYLVLYECSFCVSVCYAACVRRRSGGTTSIACRWSDSLYSWHHLPSAQVAQRLLNVCLSLLFSINCFAWNISVLLRILSVAHCSWVWPIFYKKINEWLTIKIVNQFKIVTGLPTHNGAILVMVAGVCRRRL